MADDDFLLRVLLAGDLTDCSFSPPLLPTQCAILRALALFGGCRRRELLRIIPCGDETVGQQLCRLVSAGLVSRCSVRDGKRRVSLYSLSPGGRIMVRQWERNVVATLQNLAKKLQKCQKK